VKFHFRITFFQIIESQFFFNHSIRTEKKKKLDTQTYVTRFSFILVSLSRFLFFYTFGCFMTLMFVYLHIRSIIELIENV